jgi:hypothetical protein
VAGVTVVLPYSLLKGLLGFIPLSLPVLLVLMGIMVLYVSSSELAKRFFYVRTRF